jgi:hypothetical protein
MVVSLVTPSSPQQPGLLRRLVGVLVSPRATYAAVAARPRAFGALAVVFLVTSLAQAIFLSTEVGQDAVLDQQVRVLESFGVTIPDAAFAQMESRVAWAPYSTVASQLVFLPLMAAIVAGLLVGVFSMLLGGDATFRHVYAVVAHSGAVIAVQQLFAMPLSYAAGRFSSADLGVFVPMLEETSFTALFLGAIDLFIVWWAVNLATGVGVLYKRGTGGTATGIIGIYVFIALVLAIFRSGS